MAEKKNVRIRLFKDNSRYKGDLFVSVNGVNYKLSLIHISEPTRPY